MIVPPGFLLERPDLLSSLSDIPERACAKKDTFDFELAHRDYWRLEAACKQSTGLERDARGHHD